jgi:cytochrome c oxidase subunit 2
MGVLAGAIWRRRGEREGDAPPAALERRLTRAVIGAVAVTTLVLMAMLVASDLTGRSIVTLATADALDVELIGHQWWWEVRAPLSVPSRNVVTANEIHVPVGRPVLLKSTSYDVIHSFWVPNLHGKRDLIPGRLTSTWFRADRPGVFRGQCAEFCGYQHAHMALEVVADPPDRFEAWMEEQRQPAAEPSTDSGRRGREVFLTRSCVLCHTVRGTGAFGHKGPDLTHLASRRKIAAGTLDLSHSNLEDWIRNPQAIKPGNRMPAHPLATEELDALVEYLEVLR